MGGPWLLHVLQKSLDMTLSLAIAGKEMQAHTIFVEGISCILHVLNDREMTSSARPCKREPCIR